MVERIKKARGARGHNRYLVSYRLDTRPKEKIEVSFLEEEQAINFAEKHALHASTIDIRYTDRESGRSRLIKGMAHEQVV